MPAPVEAAAAAVEVAAVAAAAGGGAAALALALMLGGPAGVMKCWALLLPKVGRVRAGVQNDVGEELVEVVGASLPPTAQLGDPCALSSACAWAALCSCACSACW